LTRPEVAFALLAALWAGQIIGVSFIATPAKFLAPSLVLPVALDVGRATFHVGSYVEAALGLALVAAGMFAFGAGPRTIVAMGVVLLLAAQHMALLPILDRRVELIMAGAQLRSSWHHYAWIAADATRVLLLLGLCVAAFRKA